MFLTHPAVQAYMNNAVAGINEWSYAVRPDIDLIFSTGPGGSQAYLTSYSFGSGAVNNYADVATLTPPSAPPFQSNFTLDPNGNVWVGPQGNTHAIAKLVPGATWTIGASWGTPGTDPAAGVPQQDNMAWLNVGNASYLVCAGFSVPDADPAQITVVRTDSGVLNFWGHQYGGGMTGGPGGGNYSVCAGPQGPMSSTAYWTCHPHSIYGTRYALGSTTITNGAAVYNPGTWPTPNAGISSSTIKSYAPTDFDAAWSSIGLFSGPAYDQTDGNVIVQVAGSGGGNPQYIAKLNTTTGAVMWKVPVGATGGFDDAAITLSVIKNGIFLYYTASGLSGTLYSINTSTGVVTTNAVTGVGSIGQQVSNDQLGCIIGNGSWGAGSIPLNATPASGSSLIAAYFIESEFEPPVPLSAISYTRTWGNWNV